MKKQENRKLLTNDLYKEISTNQSDEIVKTRAEKIEALKALKDEVAVLEGLIEDKKRLKKLIKESKINIFKIKLDKFKLSIELSKQRRLANSLTKLFTKEEQTYVDSSLYIKETTDETKKR